MPNPSFNLRASQTPVGARRSRRNTFAHSQINDLEVLFLMSQRHATKPAPQCRCALSVARALRHTVVSSLTRTLGRTTRPLSNRLRSSETEHVNASLRRPQIGLKQTIGQPSLPLDCGCHTWGIAGSQQELRWRRWLSTRTLSCLGSANVRWRSREAVLSGRVREKDRLLPLVVIRRTERCARLLLGRLP